MLTANFLDDLPHTLVLDYLSFVLVNAPDGMSPRIELGIYRHGGSITTYVCEDTTHILVFGELKTALQSKPVKDAEAVNNPLPDDAESAEDEEDVEELWEQPGTPKRHIAVVNPGFLLESIRHRELVDWKQHDVYSTVKSELYTFSPKPPPKHRLSFW